MSDSDEFDRAFDEDFVRGAEIKEPDWNKVRKRARRRQRKDQARRRMSGFGRRAGGFALIALLLVALLGVTGNGPLSFLQRSSKSSPSSGVSTDTVPGKGGSTSSTEVELTSGVCSKGDCVAWDQGQTSGPRQTVVVPCDSPHLIEMTTSIDVSGKFDHYPTGAEWDVFAKSACGPSVQALLGAPLDPHGKFDAGIIRPTRESWTASGDRTVWCGVQHVIDRPTVHPDNAIPFTGKVEGASQDELRAVGGCYTTAPFPVSCRAPHLVEITGYVDLSGRKTPPPPVADNKGWDALVGQQCANVAHLYIGHDPTGNLFAGWQPIPPESWAAGRRKVECTVGRYDKNDKAILAAGSLKG